MINNELEKLLVEYEDVSKFKELSGGMKSLLHLYYQAKDKSNLTNGLIIDDIVWDDYMEDFVNGLKKYKVKEIIFASTWSSAIVLLMTLIDNGYVVKDTVIYNESEWLGRKSIKKGIRLIKEQ